MSAPGKEAYERANAVKADMPPAQRKATAAIMQDIIDEREALRLNVPDSDAYRRATERAEKAERDVEDERSRLLNVRRDLRELMRRIRAGEDPRLTDFEDAP